MPLLCLYYELWSFSEHKEWQQKENSKSKGNRIHLPTPLTLTNWHVVSRLFNLCRNWDLKTTLCDITKRLRPGGSHFMLTSGGDIKKGHGLSRYRVSGMKILSIKHTKMSTKQVIMTHMQHIHSFNTMSIEQCQYYITVEGTSPYRSAAFICYPAFLGASFFSVHV